MSGGMPAWHPEEVPQAPGCYRFTAGSGEVLYVGKAKNLRARLGSYFTGDQHPRTFKMLSLAAGYDWICVDSEADAIQLEWSLVRKHRPKFNIKLQDDRRFPEIALTRGDVPAARITRRHRVKGERRFGPFRSYKEAQRVLDVTLTLFPVRSCDDRTFSRAESSGKACILAEIGRCAAPCVGAVSAKEHADLAEQAARFLRGDVDSKVAELEYAMSEAAKKLRYETAARLRDKISAAKEVGQPLNVVWPTDESASLVAAVADGMRAAAVVFDVRKGRMAGRSTFLFDLSEALDHTHPRKKPDYPASSEDDTDDSGKTTCDTDVDDTRLRAVVDMALSARFDLDRPDLAGKDDPPPRMLIAHTSPSDGALELLTRARREAGYSAPVRVRVPRRGPARALLDTAMSNAEDALAVDRMRSGRLSAERMVALERMAAACGFDIIPRRIECYDISHFSGTGTVASLVVFVDGSPERSSYRNFTMSKEQNDDFLSMKEVITRRLTHLGGEDSALSSPPDLILVDGGAPQLAAAVEALEDFGIEGQNVASIAKKKEELWLPGRADPVPLERDSAPMLILRHLRDEAHRRAVSHQRKKREP